MRTPEIDDGRLDQQIQKIFSCVVLHEKLSAKAVEKARQLLLLNLKQIAGEALDRSITRDGISTQLEAKDVLTAVQSRGDIYKFKIVRTLLMDRTMNQLKEKPQKDVKSIKQAEFDDKGVDDD